jgi:hypothetical protein
MFKILRLEAALLCSETNLMTKLNVAPAQLCADVLEQLKGALKLLDESEAPADIGAHLDLAINRLEVYLEQAVAA